MACTLDDRLARIAASWIDHHDAGGATAMVASSNDHVDVINGAVQAARLAVGHLDPDQSVVIAGGERAHPGDVIATRRNERRLITTSGEPVRNRETWTVTAIHADGALTVTQELGHGTVTLPVEYVREHVRLGYAATEYGYESATVTTGIELASSATTRRGLCVGVTRGRDENLICVITESNDVAEARDVLDGILVVDRADVPAVTQRRKLAAHQPPSPTPPSSTSRQPRRCQIPDWLAGLLADARHALAEAEHTVESRALERAQRAAAITTAEGDLADVDRATAPHREMLAVDAKRADQARSTHAGTQRRLADSGWRGRRDARREIDVAERVLERANAILERTRQQAAPDVERYCAAVSDLEDARTDLRHHDVATQLDSVSRRLPELARTMVALDTWQRWANGETITGRPTPRHRRGPDRRPRNRAQRSAPGTRRCPADLGWHSRHRPAHRRPSTTRAAAHRNRAWAVARRQPEQPPGADEHQRAVADDGDHGIRSKARSTRRTWTSSGRSARSSVILRAFGTPPARSGQ